MKTVTLEIPPFGRLTTEAIDAAETTRWEAIARLAEMIPGGTWALDTDTLTPQKNCRKSIPAFTAKLAELYPDPAELSAWMEEFGRFISATWTQAEEVVEDEVAEAIPEEIAEMLLPFVRWSSHSGAGVYLYTRTSDANTWAISEQTWGQLLHYCPNGGKDHALTVISSELLKLQKEGKTRWGVKISVDPKTGNKRRLFIPFLEFAGSSKLIEKIENDLRFAINTPEIFTNSPGTPCMSYFPLSELEARCIGRSQHWLNFESQFPEWAIDTWRASFYGTFVDTNRSRQIVSFFDLGQTGKTSMFRAVMQVAGNKFCAAVSKDSAGNQFWASAIYGSRLIMFSDTGNTKVSLMSKVKQLTGGDPISVEYKGRTPFSFIPNVRVWTSSNSLPDINTLERHQRSRMLVFPLTPTRDPEILKDYCALNEDGTIAFDRYGDPVNIGYDYTTPLAEEFWDYLLTCRGAYLRLCRNNQDVPIPPKMEEFIQTGCISESNGAITTMMGYFLELAPDGKLTNKQINILINTVATEGREALVKRIDVKRYLKSIGCTEGMIGSTDRGLLGVKLRDTCRISGDKIKIVENLAVAVPVEVCS